MDDLVRAVLRATPPDDDDPTARIMARLDAAGLLPPERGQPDRRR